MKSKEMPKRRVKDGKLGGGKEIPKRGVNVYTVNDGKLRRWKEIAKRREE